MEELRHAAEEALPSTATGRTKLQFFEEAPNETIITFVDDEQTPMGIEVNGLFDSSTESSSRRPESTLRLQSVQITRIEPSGRVGRDGRLKLGDRILAIDGRPVSQVVLPIPGHSCPPLDVHPPGTGLPGRSPGEAVSQPDCRPSHFLLPGIPSSLFILFIFPPGRAVPGRSECQCQFFPAETDLIRPPEGQHEDDRADDPGGTDQK